MNLSDLIVNDTNFSIKPACVNCDHVVQMIEASGIIAVYLPIIRLAILIAGISFIVAKQMHRIKKIFDYFDIDYSEDLFENSRYYLNDTARFMTLALFFLLLFIEIGLADMIINLEALGV